MVRQRRTGKERTGAAVPGHRVLCRCIALCKPRLRTEGVSLWGEGRVGERVRVRVGVRVRVEDEWVGDGNP